MLGAGAVAGAAGASADSERRRGRHAAPAADGSTTDADGSATDADRTSTESASPEAGTSAPESTTSASTPVDDEPTVVSPAESSDLVSKVNSKNSDTDASAADARASEGVTLGGDKASDAASSTPSTSDDQAGARSAADRPASDERKDDANIRSSEATVVSTPAAEELVDSDSGSSAADHSEATDSAASASAGARSERPDDPDGGEPTQYVPVGTYGNSDRSSGASSASQQADSGEETVAQTAIDNEPVPDTIRQNDREGDAGDNGGQQNRQDGGQPIIQAFWFAVPEPREAVDPTTGMPAFTIYPGDWYLSLEDNGSWFKVRDSDGREGHLRNIDGIQRG